MALYEYDDDLIGDEESSAAATITSHKDKTNARVAALLQELGYATNQTHHAPERDVEYLDHIFRDATVRIISF